ncbi:MAG: CDP-glycerol glycerophosphotransferase family protein [Lachnospiraceae bacterium]|nr:CDP-glycerol glycerophosphotransferase family protein [Lachnospiraceae bacterium]
MKKLSIIVPVYNVEKYIERCLESIISQTWHNFEVLCVDDGSTDESGSICEEYARKDSRIKVFLKENGGAASARNVGLKYATGEYIGFVDPDDWIEPEMYESIITKMEENDADMGVCGFYKNWDSKEIEMDNSPVIGEDVFDKERVFYYAFKRFSYKSFGGYLWNKVFRREVVKGTHPLLFNETLKVGEDVLFFAEATLQIKNAICVNRALYHYYQRSSSLCHAGSIEERSGSLVTYRTLISLFQEQGIDESIVQYVKRFYVYIASLLAEKAYYDEDKENMQKMQVEIGKYIEDYEATSEGHEEWNIRMRLMMKNPEEAITYSKNLSDRDIRAKYAEYLKEPVENNRILYEAFLGRGMTCGSYALFKAFMERDDFANYKHIWSIADEKNLSRLKEEYAVYPNVDFVLRKSEEYVENLAKCKFLINNNTFIYYFVKRPEQVYLNTWHGIPMKKLGYDVPDGILAQHNSFRNFLMTDYLLAWNEHMGQVFRKAYKLENMYQGCILLEGSPRNDNTLSEDRKKVLSKLKKAGVQLEENKRIITYAPTFRGANLQIAENNYAQVRNFIDAVEKEISSEDYQILYKPHHLVYEQIKKSDLKEANVIPGDFDANEILSITDILISDYSSIYFDFLVTGKPIVYYVPDEKEYEGYRGLYFNTEKLPGAVCRNARQVAEAINQEKEYENIYGDVHKRFTKWACTYDDGKVSERVLEVFLGKRDKNRAMETVSEKKRSVLIVAGSLWSEKKYQILESKIKNYNLDNTDVTVLFDEPKTEKAKERILTLDRRIRGLARVPAMVMTESEEIQYQKYLEGKASRDDVKEILNRERSRCLPGMEFDEVVVIG